VTQPLNPPPPSFETCSAVGAGTICDGARTETNDLTDTGITCGSGASAFDIFDQSALNQHATRWYDQSGNLTRRHIDDHYTFGQWSNPLTAATVTYTQTSNELDVLAVPGDFNSATTTYTGENVYHNETGAPVLFGNGRQVTNFDGSVLYESSGRNDFTLAFYENDPAVFDEVCAALAE
jgi:hypothetical protein